LNVIIVADDEIYIQVKCFAIPASDIKLTNIRYAWGLQKISLQLHLSRSKTNHQSSWPRYVLLLLIALWTLY